MFGKMCTATEFSTISDQNTIIDKYLPFIIAIFPLQNLSQSSAYQWEQFILAMVGDMLTQEFKMMIIHLRVEETHIDGGNMN